MKKTRSELRENIMTILYQINIYRKDNIEYDVNDVIMEVQGLNDQFVNNIVYGVLENENKLDEIINKYLKDWKIERFGNIDKAIFRMSTYELLFTDTPHIVSINEGILLSKKFSDEKLAKMLNAVLDEVLDNEVKHEWRNIFICNRFK